MSVEYPAVAYYEDYESACEGCGTPFAMKLWLVVMPAPDLPQLIREHGLQSHPCDKCGALTVIDAPLLVSRPGQSPAMLFSPAANTTPEEDQQQALMLLDIVKDSLGQLWRDEWVTNLAVYGSRDDLAAAVLE